MAYPWEQDIWNQPAIDQLGPYAPGPYDQPAPEREPYTSQGLAYGKMGGGGPAAGPNPLFGRSKLAHGIEAIADKGVANWNKNIGELGETISAPFEDYDQAPARGPDFMRDQAKQPVIAEAAGAEPGPQYFKDPGAPSITQDPKTGELIGSGHFNGEITPNARAGAFTGGPSSFNEAGGSSLPGGQTANWGTPDVSLAGMMNDRRARGMIDAGYEQRQKAIDFPAENARQQAMQQAQLEQEQFKANDPYQLGAYTQKKAIDLRTSVLDRKAQQDESDAAYQGKRHAFEAALRAVDADPKNAALTEVQKAELRRKAQDEFEADWLQWRQGRAMQHSGQPNKEYYSTT